MELIGSISLILTNSEMTDRCVVLIKDGKAWKRPDSKRVTDFLAYRVVEGAGGIGSQTLEFWIPRNIFADEFLFKTLPLILVLYREQEN